MRQAVSVMILVLVIAGCAPRADTEVPGAPESIYHGEFEDVYGEVVAAISTSPGLPNSNGWIITSSDSVGGFIRAETTVTTFNWLTGRTTRRESLSVVVAPRGEARTSVVIQFTGNAQPLAERIRSFLDDRFGEPDQV